MDFLPHCSFLRKLCHLHPELIIRKKIPPNFAFWGSNNKTSSALFLQTYEHISIPAGTLQHGQLRCVDGDVPKATTVTHNAKIKIHRFTVSSALKRRYRTAHLLLRYITNQHRLSIFVCYEQLQCRVTWRQYIGKRGRYGKRKDRFRPPRNNT